MNSYKRHKINLISAATAMIVLSIVAFVPDYFNFFKIKAQVYKKQILVSVENSSYIFSRTKTVRIPAHKVDNRTPDFELDFTKMQSGTNVDFLLNTQDGVDKYWDPKWNNERQMYSSNNVSIQNGELVIKAKVENDQITSGRVDTRNLFSATYGEFEIEAKLPVGVGTFPAIWLLPEDSSYFRDNIATEQEKQNDLSWMGGGEIDMAETLGAIPGDVYNVAHNYNTIETDKSPEFGTTKINTEKAEYHLYGLEWTPESLTFKVDGVTTLVLHKNSEDFRQWPFDKPFYLIINLAMGGNWNDSIVGNKFDKGIDTSKQDNWTLSVKKIKYFSLATED